MSKKKFPLQKERELFCSVINHLLQSITVQQQTPYQIVVSITNTYFSAELVLEVATVYTL